MALLEAILSLPAQQSEVSAFMSVWLAGWSVGVFILSRMAVAAWHSLKHGVKSDYSTTSILGAILITLFGLPFWAGEVVGLGLLVRNGSAWLALLLAFLVGTNVLFHYLLKVLTLAGRAVLDQVEGFRKYFLEDERDPMQRLSEPAITPELFEEHLPYAVALGGESAWSARFAAALAEAGKPDYGPDWYVGSDWGSLGPARFATTVGSALTNAVASASSAPGSSSGGDGGGSSGGGGGGGGGGGW